MSQQIQFSASDVKVTSGAFEGSKEQLKQLVAIAIGNGAFRGMMKAVEIIKPDLAQRTGAFRRVFEQATEEVIQDQMGQSQIEVNIKEITSKMIAKLDYAEYHIDGRPHHSGQLFYEDPTTSGTRPLDTNDLKLVGQRQVRREIFNEFRSLGLEFTVKS